MDERARGHRYQGTTRAYLPAPSQWARLSGGDPRTLLLLRLLPVTLTVLTLPIAYVDEVMIPYASYVLVAMPAMTALVNGPWVTALASLFLLALVSAGSEALGLLPFPPSYWSDVPPLAAIGLLCVLLAWVRHRVVTRLDTMTVVAEIVQKAIIPELPERIGGVRLSSVYRTAADSPGLVGGDFFDVQDTDFGLRAIVGDVQGHDLATVRLTETLLGAFRERSLDDPDLAALADHLERRTARENLGRDEWEQRFATAALLEIAPDRSSISVVLCGHPAPLLVRDSASGLSPRPRPPLGLADLCPGAGEIATAPLAPGDMVVAYTDGLVEARNAAGRTFPLVSLVNAHATNGVRDPEGLREHLRADFFGGEYVRRDDLTILFMKMP